jgi:hypothetical protein
MPARSTRAPTKRVTSPLKKKKKTKRSVDVRGKLYKSKGKAGDDADLIINSSSHIAKVMTRDGSHQKLIAVLKAILSAARRDSRRKKNVYYYIQSDPALV